MATTVTKTIRSSGGDYTTLTAWEAAIPANLVTEDEQWVAECYDDWPSGLSDSPSITNHTTDTTRNIILTVADGEGHNGDQTGFFMTGYIRVANNYGDIVGLRLSGNTAYGGAKIAYSDMSTGFSLLDSVHIHDSTANGVGFSNANWGCRNSLFDSVSRAFYSASTRAAEVDNCTVIDCGDYGALRAIFTNCVVYGSTNTDYLGAHASSDYNASEDTSAPGSNSITGIASTDFNDYANNDYSPASDSALIDAGTDLSTEFTTDIVGTTRG